MAATSNSSPGSHGNQDIRVMSLLTLEQLKKKQVAKKHRKECKVSGDQLHYEETKGGWKTTIDLSDLDEIEMNDKITIERHKYDNVICLRKAGDVKFLKAETRKQMHQWYDYLVGELTRLGWNYAETKTKGDQVKRRATNPEGMLQIRKLVNSRRNIVSACEGTVGGFESTPIALGLLNSDECNPESDLSPVASPGCNRPSLSPSGVKTTPPIYANEDYRQEVPYRSPPPPPLRRESISESDYLTHVRPASTIPIYSGSISEVYRQPSSYEAPVQVFGVKENFEKLTSAQPQYSDIIPSPPNKGQNLEATSNQRQPAYCEIRRLSLGEEHMEKAPIKHSFSFSEGRLQKSMTSRRKGTPLLDTPLELRAKSTLPKSKQKPEVMKKPLSRKLSLPVTLKYPPTQHESSEAQRPNLPARIWNGQALRAALEHFRNAQDADSTRVILNKADVMSGKRLCLVKVKNHIWIHNWKPDGPPLYDKLHIGDQLLSISLKNRDVSFAFDMMASVEDKEVSVTLRRAPYARALLLQRSSDDMNLGIELLGNVIKRVDSTGVFGQMERGKTTGVINGDLVEWAITEINMQPLHFNNTTIQVQNLLDNAGLNVSLVIQPADLMQAMKYALSGCSHCSNHETEDLYQTIK